MVNSAAAKREKPEESTVTDIAPANRKISLLATLKEARPEIANDTLFRAALTWTSR
jgi:hypothetical protein